MPVMRFWGTALALLALLLALSACQDAGPARALAAGAENQGVAAGGRSGVEGGGQGAGGWPAFPAQAGAASPARRAADSAHQVLGTDYAEQSAGSASYADTGDPGAYVLVPLSGGAEGGARMEKLAWARYSVAGLTGDRPVALHIDAAPAPAQPGGAALPLNYYVGLSDYTRFGWEWRGPFTAAVTLPLNPILDGGTVSTNDRYISADGTLHFVIAADAYRAPAAPPDNPLGLVAARVRSATATTAPGYMANRPHFPLIEALYAGESHGGSSVRKAAAAKATSSLLPEQFIHVEWTHVAPFGPADVRNEAKLYLTTRQGPGQATPVLIGDRAGAGFIDPSDHISGAAPPVPGTTYRYFVQALNDNGATPLCASRPITVPLTAPQGLTATQNGAEDGVRLHWSAVAGAVSYELWRGQYTDPQYAEQIATVPAPATTYLDAAARPGFDYVYFVRAVGQGDGNSANGLEDGAVGPFSLYAPGLRKVVLAIACATAGVNGTGAQLDPFQLESDSAYLFSASDQDGNDITAFVSWAVSPAGSAAFGPAPPNQLHDLLAGAGALQLTARFAYLTYVWTGSAYADVP
jgi:hypothetical protein